MEELLGEFGEYLKVIKKMTPNTCASYKLDIKKLFSYARDREVTEIKNITEDMISDYVRGLYDSHLSSSTIARNICSIRAFYKFALENGNVNRDVSEFLEAPASPQNEPRILTLKEAEYLLSIPDDAYIKGMRDKAILELMYATGIRASEIIGLNLKDLDLQLDLITVRNNKCVRQVPYGQRARKALLKYLQDARPAWVLDESQESIFVNYKGEKLSRQGLWKMMKNYVKKAGIREDVTPDILRNSFAVHMIENGADIESVKTMLGISSSSQLIKHAANKSNKLRDVYNRAHVLG
ncbi:MAG: tyrosine-type recombinase/integrase [Butyrivibrio sp.]|nr:tyrosine-type recombinase/integrase [Butyrivibrio sp.]